MNRIALTSLLGAVTLSAVAACSTSTTGNGSQNGSLAVSDGASSSASSTAASSSASVVVSDSAVTSDTPSQTPSTQTATATVTHTTTTHPTTTHPTSSTPTPVKGPADLGPITSTAVHCTSTSDTGEKVTLTWTATGANKYYVLEGAGAVELQGVDAKSSGGVDTHGAKKITLPYNCNNNTGTDYYLVEAYNTFDGTHSGTVEQIAQS